MTSRSSFLLWLLLLATISITAVVSMWMFDEGLDGSTGTVYWGLTFGELSVLCAAMTRSQVQFRVAWMLPFLFGLLAAFVMAVADGIPEYAWEQLAPVESAASLDAQVAQGSAAEHQLSPLLRWEPLTSLTSLYWLHAAAVLLTLWLLRPTSLFMRFTGRAPANRWHFSVMQLLLLMTGVALLCTALTRAERIIEDAGTIVSVATLPIANSLLLVAVLAATQSDYHFLARLSLCLSAAMIIAAVCGVVQLAFADEINIFVYALLQALMMWVWFELMRPGALTDAASDAQSLQTTAP